MKKLLLSLGAVAAVVTPVVTVVSCGSSSDSIDITKGDGKIISDVIKNDMYAKATLGDVTSINTNLDFHSNDDPVNKYVQIAGTRGTAKLQFTDSSIKLFFADKDKKMSEVKEGDPHFDTLKDISLEITHAFGN